MAYDLTLGINGKRLTEAVAIPFPVDVRTIVYCVTENGNKFILGEPVDRNKSLTVVLDWTAGLKR